ncbi:elongin-C-like [Canis lupus familiaris]|uniref:elongin-C-like n=1 Tax=Canis lupus familiaris TaxID=9615 RepID=UPI0003AE209F|nr:elongin-C-like [Canis lupus familiaris]XP_038316957.1 elongin-C-like [Canis lupus familiaris]
MYVKSVPLDDHEFIIERQHVLMSRMIKAILRGLGQFAENEIKEVSFRANSSRVLAKVHVCSSYVVGYTNNSTEIPEFPTAPKIAGELLMAANFPDC